MYYFLNFQRTLFHQQILFRSFDYYYYFPPKYIHDLLCEDFSTSPLYRTKQQSKTTFLSNLLPHASI